MSQYLFHYVFLTFPPFWLVESLFLSTGGLKFCFGPSSTLLMFLFVMDFPPLILSESLVAVFEVVVPEALGVRGGATGVYLAFGERTLATESSSSTAFLGSFPEILAGFTGFLGKEADDFLDATPWVFGGILAIVTTDEVGGRPVFSSEELEVRDFDSSFLFLSSACVFSWSLTTCRVKSAMVSFCFFVVGLPPKAGPPHVRIRPVMMMSKPARTKANYGL